VSQTRTADAASTGGDMDLWAHVWGNVESPGDVVSTPVAAASESPPWSRANEAAMPTSVEILVPKRQRLTEKAPPVLAIEVYKRRLIGKQPSPTAHNRDGPKLYAARGHYDVLGIRRTAPATEIHAAYRRRARATHPDKGGDASDFHKVVAAFEELADEGRRAAYDRNLDFFGRKDGTGLQATSAGFGDSLQPGGGEAQGPAGMARIAHAKCLAEAQNMWARGASGVESKWADCLGEMQRTVLEALRKFLQPGPKKKPAQNKAAKSSSAAKAAAAGKTGGKTPTLRGLSCITHQAGGYKVLVPWASLSVATGLTESVAEALDWQAALMWVRGTAQARMRRDSQGEPLVEAELLQLLEAEPTIELTFTVEVEITQGGKKKKKVSSPAMQDLKMAMDVHRRFLVAAKARKAEEALQKERKRAEREAGEARRRRQTCERALLAAVILELNSRSGYMAVEAPARRSPAGKGKAAEATASKTKRKDASEARAASTQQNKRARR